MKLTRIKRLGRYIDQRNNKAVNVHCGTDVDKNTPLYFYLWRGCRVVITEAEFWQYYSKVIPVMK